MNQNKDIIGIVKELQQIYANDFCSRTADGECPEAQKYIDAFPAIAQALLIAVEALESIDDYTTDIQKAQAALSRIRSLT
jgi:hypothetical protein